MTYNGGKFDLLNCFLYGMRTAITNFAR